MNKLLIIVLAAIVGVGVLGVVFFGGGNLLTAISRYGSFIKVLSPNGGEVWIIGRSEVIKWAGGREGDTIRLALLQKSTDSNWITALQDDYDNMYDGYVSRFIPSSVPEGKYKVQACVVLVGDDKCDPKRIDRSDSVFEIKTGGRISVDSVGPDGTAVSRPPETYVAIDGAYAYVERTPELFAYKSGSTHKVYATNAKSYAEKAGTCVADIRPDGTTGDCIVTSFSIVPICDDVACFISVKVLDKKATFVVFKYESLLYISRDPMSPPDRGIVPGKTNVEVARFRITNNTKSDVMIQNFGVQRSNAGPCYFQNLKIRDSAGAQVGGTRSPDSGCAASFGSVDPVAVTLNFVIPKDNYRTLSLYLDIPVDASIGDIFAFKVDAIAVEGSVIPAGVGIAGNLMKIVAPDLSAALAPPDEDTKEGYIYPGTEAVLAKFVLSAKYEDMIVTGIRFSVTPTPNPELQTASSVDEIPTIKLFDGTTQIGSISGYPVAASGADAGSAIIQGLSLKILKDTSKVITIKGVVSATGANGVGSDMGSEIYLNLQNKNFSASGQTSKDINIEALSGNKKIVASPPQQ